MSFPENLNFKTPELELYAKTFEGGLEPFWKGGIFSEKTTEWNNVFFHCLTCAAATEVLTDAIKHNFELIFSKDEMRWAALYHDAHKRLEVEGFSNNDSQPNFFFEIDERANEWLKNFSIRKEVADLLNAFGNNATMRLFKSSTARMEDRILHLIDDSVQDDCFIGHARRLQLLESHPRYSAQSKAARIRFDGLTLFEAKEQIHLETIEILSSVLPIKDSSSLALWMAPRLHPILGV